MATQAIQKPPKKDEKKSPQPQMTISGHLGELRFRLMWCALAIVGCTVITWYFHKELVAIFLDLAKKPIETIIARGGKAPTFVYLDVASGFTIYFETALMAGFMLASPVIIYHILAFIAPALEPESRPGDPGYEKEVQTLKTIRRTLILFIPVVAVFFFLGVLFTYYLVLPAAVNFLLSFGSDQLQATIDTKKYVGQMSKTMLAMGVVFELPVFMYLLARIRVVDWKRMAGFWKFALVLSLVAAAFITPSPDIWIQFVIAGPIFALFWLGVLFARFAK
jgi:sec-independent protein translocase protein TatC